MYVLMHGQVVQSLYHNIISQALKYPNVHVLVRGPHLHPQPLVHTFLDMLG